MEWLRCVGHSRDGVKVSISFMRFRRSNRNKFFNFASLHSNGCDLSRNMRSLRIALPYSAMFIVEGNWVHTVNVSCTSASCNLAEEIYAVLFIVEGRDIYVKLAGKHIWDCILPVSLIVSSYSRVLTFITTIMSKNSRCRVKTWVKTWVKTFITTKPEF